MWQEGLLGASVSRLRGVGPARQAELATLGVLTLGDLIRHVPRDYEDRSQRVPIAQLRPGEKAAFLATVVSLREQTPRPKLHLLKATLEDSSGRAEAVWFNQAFRLRELRPGRQLVFYGRVERNFGQLQVNNPEVEAATAPAQVLPIYPAKAGLTQRVLRHLIWQALEVVGDRLPDPVPEEIRRRLALLPATTAWRQVHFPASREAARQARQRLAFDELFLLQLGLGAVRAGNSRQLRGFRYPPPGELAGRFLRQLPFRLTPAQERVVAEIERDFASPQPLNRLVQGDVGSGKTVVAAYALVRAVEAGHQGALMAPTEILAEQHGHKLGQWLGALGLDVRLLTGSLPADERAEALARLASGETHVVIGTHALIQEGVRFRQLGLVVTDEQHRFGVRQRERLVAMGEWPDVLVMTATPIPRTLALTLYGDLDVSAIDGLPPGRRPVRTHWRTSERRDRVYEFVRQEALAGRQAYVVCPLVEESEEVDAASATALWQELSQRLSGVHVGLLHGRLKAEEKARTMEAFRKGELQVLVATTVIEVGVDVPNATVMVIEGAERFGLSQLHQLRGRVGRGKHASHCILLSDAATEEARQRMEAMVRTHDGFAIAEADLELRGPGEILGTRQHGLPELILANPVRDLALLEAAREEAKHVLARDPHLTLPEHAGLRQALLDHFGERLHQTLVG